MSSQIERRDKKDFFNEQCIKLKENNRRGKTNDLFRKIGETREYFLQRWAEYRTEMVDT